MRTPTLNHYFEPKIMRIIIEIIRYLQTVIKKLRSSALWKITCDCLTSDNLRRKLCEDEMEIVSEKL